MWIRLVAEILQGVVVTVLKLALKAITAPPKAAGGIVRKVAEHVRKKRAAKKKGAGTE